MPPRALTLSTHERPSVQPSSPNLARPFAPSPYHAPQRSDEAGRELMAARDGEGAEGRPRRRRSTRSPSPIGKHDWDTSGNVRRHSLPFRPQGRETIRSGRGTSSLRRSQTSSISRPKATMHDLRRPTTPPYSRGHFPDVYDQASASDSRMSSRRDLTPRSVPHYASTPASRPSSRTSLSDSDAGSAKSYSTQDERRGRRSVRGHTATPESRRRRRRRHRRHTIFEEVAPEAEGKLGPRHYVDRNCHSPSPTRQSPSPRRASRRKVSSPVETPRATSFSKRASRRSYETEIVCPDRLPKRSSAGGSRTPPAHNVTASAKRPSILENIFSASGRTPEKPVKIVSCVVCMGEFPSHKTAKLKCSHRMCNACLKRNFKLSITDPQHMPPKCCTPDYIPLKHVDKLFDVQFKKSWNKRFVEFSTRNRLYCPSRKCGEFIPPQNIYRENGRKCGRCARCKTKVCVMCNRKWHGSSECARDDATNKLLAQAKESGWQRCYKCKAMIELMEGCNHMTCRCGAEFCMTCGAKWRTCSCPWFNYENESPHMSGPLEMETERFEAGPPPSPRDVRTAYPPVTLRTRVHTEEEEGLLRRFRGSREAESVRRHDDYDEDEDDGGDEDDNNNAKGLELVRIGSLNDHFAYPDEEYSHSHNTLPSPARAHPFERSSSGADYVAGVSKARGLKRSSSLERRLADRFNQRNSPLASPARHGLPPGPPQGPPPPMMGAPHIAMHPLPIRGHMPLLRRHTMEEEIYNHARTTRPSERVIPSRSRRDYEAEAAVHAPSSRRRRHDGPNQSSMAGLTGHGSGMNRVFEWRTHVQPGLPEGEATTPV